MPVENVTPNRSYQLPDIANFLEDDWPRIISALNAIDADMATALATIVGFVTADSPAFTGTPTAPTATPGTDSTQIATTAFAKLIAETAGAAAANAAVSALVDASPGTLDTLNELAAALGDDPNFAATMTAALAGKAAASHSHPQSEITNLVADLAGKAAASHNHSGVYEPVDADILRADTAKVLTAGFAGAVYDNGVQSSGTLTIDEANGNFQKAVNGGAHAIAPPSNNCTVIVEYTNNGSAGALTTSAIDLVDGDSLTTVNGDVFHFYITKTPAFSYMLVKVKP